MFNENFHKKFFALYLNSNILLKFYCFCLAAVTAGHLTIIFTVYVSTHEMNKLCELNYLSTIYINNKSSELKKLCSVYNNKRTK